MSDKRDQDELGLVTLEDLLDELPPERRAIVGEKARKLLDAENRRVLDIAPNARLSPDLISRKLRKRVNNLRVAADLLHKQCEANARRYFQGFGIEIPDQLTEEIIHKLVERCISMCSDERAIDRVQEEGGVLLACLTFYNSPAK